VLTGDAEPVERLTIPAGTAVEVIVRVIVPPEAYRGVQNTTTLDAEVEEP
jgi:hypothetical protein